MLVCLCILQSRDVKYLIGDEKSIQIAIMRPEFSSKSGKCRLIHICLLKVPLVDT